VQTAKTQRWRHALDSPQIPARENRLHLCGQPVMFFQTDGDRSRTWRTNRQQPSEWPFIINARAILSDILLVVHKCCTIAAYFLQPNGCLDIATGPVLNVQLV
jgi:hypothetical protein